MALEDRIRLPALNLIHRRPRLLNMLAGFVETGHRLITVHAPGGYGKSIFLADFAQTTNLPVCWCSLEPADRDPTSFLTLLAHSIIDRFHEIEPEPLLNLVERGDTDATIHRIVALLSTVGPHIIIIDDYHKAISAGMTLVLNKLLEQLPDASTIIVAARDDVNLETGQILELLIAERATGLSEEELRFTPEELQLVMRKRFGRQLSMPNAEEIALATAGNIAQILLAGHMMRAGQTVTGLNLLGDDRDLIYNFLAGEVFGKQTESLQRFMLYTSVLPYMTPELCNPLLEIDDSYRCIDALNRNDLFITQIGTGFKYHDLFAEFLRNKLAADEATYVQVSARAAQLLADQAQFEDAINLYLSVQAWHEAADLMETKSRFFYDTGRALTLYSWLSQLAEDELAGRPRLLMLFGRILNMDLNEPQTALDFYQQAEEKFRGQDDLTGVAEAQIIRASALRMVGQVKEALDLTANGLEQLEELEADSRLIAWAIRYRGLANSAVGSVEAALSDLRGALALFEAQEDSYNVGLSHHDIGVCLEKSGNIDGARHHYMQALRIWEVLGNGNDMANTLNSLGVSAYLSGDFKEAAGTFRESLDIAVQIGSPRRIAFAQAGLGDAYLGQKRYESAIEFYQKSIESAREAEVQSLEIYDLVKLGECFLQQDDLSQALRLALQAREIALAAGLSFEQGLAAALQAKIYVRRAEYEASFDLFATALACIAGNDIIEKVKVRLWWGYSLLLDLRAAAALEQLQEGISLTLTISSDLMPGLGPTVTETQKLLRHFLYRQDTPAGIKDGINLLLQQRQEETDITKLGLQVFAFGAPSLIVADVQKQFTQRGGSRKAPEFLLYLILAGRGGGRRWSDVCAAIWPDMEPQKASVLFHQYVKRFRKVIFETSDYLVLNDDYYQIPDQYLNWCDVLAFETLFERAGKRPPDKTLELYLEIIALYRGELLSGFELGEWGMAYRATCENRFLQVVSLASQQLLSRGAPQEALNVIHKGLDQDYFRENLHRHALWAYAQAGLYDQLEAHYDQLCTVFEEELGGPPDAETTLLYQHLRLNKNHHQPSVGDPIYYQESSLPVGVYDEKS